MDFIKVAYKENQDGSRSFYPSLQATESQDLVIRGGQFVAIWDEDKGLYSRQQSHVPDIIDRAFSKMVGGALRPGDTITKMRVFDNGLFNKLISLMRNIGDMGPELDQRIVFADEEVKKEYAATFKMPYSLSDAPHPAWNKIVSTLYAQDERTKIEYAIGSILSGASITMQKFYVLYGPPGSGKSTILNIIELLFEGHTATFNAADLGKADKQFALEPFARNPLVGVDQDADLSRIELNVNLNLIVSHDRVLINAKGKNLYGIIPRTCLFIGTNEPVKISNRKSGLFRRLVDIQPTGDLIEEEHYHQLMEQVKFELGSIARHCINVFNQYGPTFLSSYRSHDMMYRTNDIFNFVEDNRLILAQGCTLKQAHKLFTEWCAETDTRNVYKQYQFRDLLSDYFDEFHEQIMLDGTRHRSYFQGLKVLEKFSWKGLVPEPTRNWLELTETNSLLDIMLADEKAQYSSAAGTPKLPWDVVTTTLKELDTTKIHFTKTPPNLITIDFDLKDERGEKSLEKNLAAAAKFPPTYAEVSKSGQGLHLEYIYDGDVELLAAADPDGMYEIKVMKGNSSLRRAVSLCNNLQVAHISSGLPLKEEKAVLSPKQIGSEKGLREQILKCITKQYHMHTKPSMDFLAKILDDAVKQGMAFDVTDMYDDILSFAMSSSNSRDACLQILLKLPLKSDFEYELVSGEEKPIQIYDLEVYPNLFAIGWMYDRDDAEVVKLLNPSTAEVEAFLEMGRREGFNIRGYDEHILHLASMGATNMELYKKSQEIISNQKGATFRAAYNTGYADLFDIIVEKHTLKWWQIKLGLPHMEMDLPWDQPVPEDRVLDVLDYMANDVKSTRALKHHRMADYKARQILAELTGMEMINTNRQLTERLIFGDIPWDTKPDLVYTDLSEMFPGYKFNQFAPAKEKSTYKGINVGEGGWVDSTPGMYTDVDLLDVASMHPTSAIELNLFGQYTPKFKELLDVRLGIKKANALYKEEKFAEAEVALKEVGAMFNGKLAPFVTEIGDAKMLSDALKIVVNSVYGLTAASFPNKFKDERNIDNIVAKRGALFMVDLKEYIENELGAKVIHVKTDSVKIVGGTPEIRQAIMEFGQRYGYTFEHEATYEKFCLVNDAVYVCRKKGKWEATGAQFQHPVVFKTLFSKEEFEAKDYVETKQVQKGAMYLVSEETGFKQFVGRFGAFVPVLGGRELLRIDGEKEAAVTGTKGFRWELDEIALNGDMDVDMNYFQGLVNAAVEQIGKYGDVVEFTRP